MKLLAINGSPRKGKNTAQMLGEVMKGAASKGAETELVHLVELPPYRGCISCFACKLIGGPSYGRCAVKDSLQPLLQKAHEADIVVLGSPIYLFTESGLMRSFFERFCFQYLLYSLKKPPLAPKKKGTALVYTMNATPERIEQAGGDKLMAGSKMFMERMFGSCEILQSYDTLQFDDYNKYDHDMWDVPAKQKRHAEIFPQDLQKAFALGEKLAG